MGHLGGFRPDRKPRVLHRFQVSMRKLIPGAHLATHHMLDVRAAGSVVFRLGFFRAPRHRPPFVSCGKRNRDSLLPIGHN